MIEQIKINRQIIKSLLLIVSIIIFSYLIFSISLQLIPLIISNSSIQYLIIHICGQLLSISGIIDAPVLYYCRLILIRIKFNFFFFSTEYRKAMQNDLPFIKKLAKKFNWKIEEDLTKIKSITIIKPLNKINK
ncbi:hypothetical protein Mgra_00002420 [Meloidogyne graminicola]|uniref:Uncharacterized protein n=1 Tax=Meloidogyne graminicola TaxID=189291 RepID=A0A8S9ZY08_9BILA|nr:hypothetical protein Mgra_00002420 [Meloidogyne graminicola]